jgi:hypothetical protein
VQMSRIKKKKKKFLRHFNFEKRHYLNSMSLVIYYLLFPALSYYCHYLILSFLSIFFLPLL